MELDLRWTWPGLNDTYLSKPEDYICHLLGHEGEGSLLSYLKVGAFQNGECVRGNHVLDARQRKGWADGLAARTEEESQDFCFLCVEVRKCAARALSSACLIMARCATELTVEGERHINEIIDAVYRYVLCSGLALVGLGVLKLAANQVLRPDWARGRAAVDLGRATPERCQRIPFYARF